MLLRWRMAALPRRRRRLVLVRPWRANLLLPGSLESLTVLRVGTRVLSVLRLPTARRAGVVLR